MKTLHIILLTAFAAGIAATGPVFGQGESQGGTAQAEPAPGGMLRTMPHGRYQCALPGDAGGDAYVVVEEEEFRIFTASRYETAQGTGTYILRGKDLTFTLGPKKGERFERVGDNQLRKLKPGGEASDLLCTRRGSR